MADNAPAAAKRMRLDTDHDEDSTSAPLPPSLDAELFVEHDHPSTVLEGLNRLRLNATLCDLILCCEGQEFPCHRYVLASFSSYFEAMFTSGMKESTHERVTISGVEPETIGLLVSYAYTSKVSISAANVQALLEASNLWDIMAVREACCDYMERHLDTHNCVGVYCFAEAHSCEKLEKHSMDYILEHFRVIYQQEEFLSLSMERLTQILSSDHLNVTKEDMVFEAAMLWLDKDHTRRLTFEKVLEQIRLPLISPSYRHTVSESVDQLKELKGCQSFISEARKQARSRGKNRPKPGATTRPGRRTVIVTVGGRCRDTDNSYKMKSFDLLTSQWKTLRRLPDSECGNHSVVMAGSTLYLTSFQGEMWRYDVNYNSWLKMAPMNERHSFMTHGGLLTLDGYVYAVVGKKDSMERYDPSINTWQIIKCAGLAAAHKKYKRTSVVALDGLLYFIGVPHSSHEDRHGVQVVVKYDLETSVWTEVAPMQIARYDPAVCTLNGKIYLIGGAFAENTMECYNPKTDQWNVCASMKEPRCDSGVVVVEGKIYVLGGMKGGYESVLEEKQEFQFSNSIERYCEETDSWETVGQMPTSRHSARYALNCVSFRLRDDFPYSDDDDDDDEEVVDSDDDDGAGSSYTSDSSDDGLLLMNYGVPMYAGF